MHLTRHKAVRGAVCTVAAHVEVAIKLIGQGIHVGLGLHGLMECSIKYQDLGLAGHNREAALNALNVCGCVQGGKIVAKAQLFEHLVGQQNRLREISTAVHHAVTHCLDLIHRGNAAVLGIEQLFYNDSHCLGMVFHGARFAHALALYKLLVLIVSHAHSDHMAALPLLLDDGRFCVTEIYAPARSFLGSNVESAIPSLVEHEDKLETLCQGLAERGHTAKGITRLAYGKPITLKMGSEDAILKIYPSHIDWSEDRPTEREGIRFILANNSENYKDNPQVGYTNGILNGNSLWVKVTKGERSVLITGDQRDSDEMLGSMIRYYGKGELACDVLKLTHHGEENYPPYLLEVARPSITVFTTSHEKAKRETVELCEEMGLVNYYACDGDLFIHTNGKEIRVTGIDPR